MVKVGLVYNLKRRADDEAEAEFDSEGTVEALATAIRAQGHDVLRLEAGPELPRMLQTGAFDIAFNIAEGYRGRGREALVPALLELHQIEYTGSDPVALALTLDKGLAKKIVHGAGLHTAAAVVMRTGRETLAPGMDYPLMVKPIAEGSSKGVFASNVVHSREELIAAVGQNLARYRQPALVETFLTGREFTIGVLGESRLRVLPPLEVVFTSDSKTPIYGYDQKKNSEGVRFECPPSTLDRKLAKELETTAKRCFKALGCRDVARIDLRLDAQGRINFIECNPLPGLAPGWSDLCVIGEAAGMNYEALVAAILQPGLKRLRDARRRAPTTSAATQ